MLLEEARWFGQMISETKADDVSPMLNIGSGTGELREERQPWVENEVFKVAADKGVKVLHTDLQNAPGVDLVGDLSDTEFRKKLQAMKFKSVFCSNLMEHITNREEVAELILSIIPVGAYLFLSCPYKYPYHPTPIDTGYRPTVEELAQLFPGTTIIKGELVTGGNYLQLITNNPLQILRIFMPFYRPKRWLGVISKLAYLFRNYQASCVLLRKDN